MYNQKLLKTASGRGVLLLSQSSRILDCLSLLNNIKMNPMYLDLQYVYEEIYIFISYLKESYILETFD